MKTKILIATKLTVLVLLLFSCKDEQIPTETIDPRLLKVIGNYTASKFFLTDPSDDPVDILKIGGSVTTEIKKDMTLSARVIIPREFYKGYSGMDYQTSGTVEFKGNDTIKFNNTNSVVSGRPYRIMGDSLKAESSTVIYFALTLKKFNVELK